MAVAVTVTLVLVQYDSTGAAWQYWCRMTLLVQYDSTGAAWQYWCRMTLLVQYDSTGAVWQYWCSMAVLVQYDSTGAAWQYRCSMTVPVQYDSTGAVWQYWCSMTVLLQNRVECSRYRPGVAQRVGRGIALLFHDRGTRRGWVVSSTPRPHFTPGKDPVPILREAGWAPGPVWAGGKSRPHRDSIPDRPARSQSLYWQNYRAHTITGYYV